MRVLLDLDAHQLLAVFHQLLAGEAVIARHVLQHGFEPAHFIDDGDLRQRIVLGGVELHLGALQLLDLVLGVREVLIRFRSRVHVCNERAQAITEFRQVGKHLQGALDLHGHCRQRHDRRGNDRCRWLNVDVGGHVFVELVPRRHDALGAAWHTVVVHGDAL